MKVKMLWVSCESITHLTPVDQLCTTVGDLATTLYANPTKP